MKKTVIILFAMLTAQGAIAQHKKQELENRANLVFGLNQIMVNGFNIEGNILWRRLAFDYSHGVSLNINNDLLAGDAADQGLAVHLPYTTGFGIGYRFTEWFNVRVEPKWHKHEIFYDGQSETSDNMIGDYKTFTLGLGAYVNWLPFKKKDNLLKGILIAPSLRYWPKVYSSLNGDSFQYDNTITGQAETHEALEVGFAGTPWIFNVSVGYSIKF